MDYRKLTILHSNDMHGDFTPEEIDGKKVGGLSMLSGYVRKVREEEESAIYVIAGDMLQGSLIDSEFMGVSTIDLINLMQPDVVSLGNHEVDYGFGHLMFLARCAKFPIVNANLFVKNIDARLFDSHLILNVNGLNILFIGILTEDILDLTDEDPILNTFVDVHAAAREVEFIINNYRNVDIDLTVLLTHIGIDKDRELASLLKPELGVDLIIGGHSHTFMEQPEEVNNIVIAQAATGTNHIGRFDLVIDKDLNSIAEYRWQMVPVCEPECSKDPVMEAVLNRYIERTEEKYNRILTALPRRLEHGDRHRETELGNAAADALANSLGVDLFILGSGSLRTDGLGPLVTLGDLNTLFPYDDAGICLTITGKELRAMLQFFYQTYAAKKSLEYYQYNRGTLIRYDRETGYIKEIRIQNQPLDDKKTYTIVFQNYHIVHLAANFGREVNAIPKVRPDRTVTTSCRDILQESLAKGLFTGKIEGRIIAE